MARLEVTSASKGLTAVTGSGQDKIECPVLPAAEVNIGLNYVALNDALDESSVGRLVHIAFEGWSETKGGNRCRNFTVLDLTEDSAKHGDSAEESEEDYPSSAVDALAGDDEWP